MHFILKKLEDAIFCLRRFGCDFRQKNLRTLRYFKFRLSGDYSLLAGHNHCLFPFLEPKLSKKSYGGKCFFTRKVPGFSLIELSFVMIIAGILMAAVFKGQELLETARLQACATDLNHYRLAIMTYRDQFGQLPGNDAHATGRFGNMTTNGKGNGIISKAEQPLVWQHLYLANLSDSGHSPSTRIGGAISVVTNPKPQLYGNFLVLSKISGTLMPLLTPQQAMILKSRIGESRANSGAFQVIEGEGVSAGACVRNGEFNLKNKSPACIILVPL